MTVLSLHDVHLQWEAGSVIKVLYVTITLHHDTSIVKGGLNALKTNYVEMWFGLEMYKILRIIYSTVLSAYPKYRSISSMLKSYNDFLKTPQNT